MADCPLSCRKIGLQANRTWKFQSNNVEIAKIAELKRKGTIFFVFLCDPSDFGVKTLYRPLLAI
jgi:hypothetical protein